MRRTRWQLVRPVNAENAERENVRFWALLLAHILVLLALVVASVAVAAFSSPWLGALIGAASSCLWIKFVPSGPGCAQGILCVTGAAVLLGAIIGCVVRAFA